jgi:hypothetical protein
MNADQEGLNPYQSPQAADSIEPRPISRAEAEAKLRVPAIGLAATSVGCFIWGVGTMFIIDKVTAPQLVFIAAMLLVLPVVVFVSAVQVARGRTAVWSWIAIVSGLIPVGTGCVCLSLPMAFWLLHLMMQRPIREALRRSTDFPTGSNPA